MNKKTFVTYALVLVVSILFFATQAKAEVTSFNFTYNEKTGRLDFSNSSSPITSDKTKDISIVEFAKSTAKGKYILSLYDSNQNMIVETEFNPTSGNFSLEIPFFSLANYAKIFNKQTNEKILEISLSQFTACNGNGICEFEKGETMENCLGDCASSQVAFSEETKKLLTQGNGAIRNEETGETLLRSNDFSTNTAQETLQTGEEESNRKNNSLLIFGLIFLGLILIGGGFWWYFNHHKNS